MIQDNTTAGDWSNNLFAGVAYFLMGDKDEGIACVELNTDFEYECDISGAVLAQMKAGKLSLEVLPNELRGIASAFEEREKLLRDAQDKELALVLSNYFEGNEKSAEEALERIAETSSNPVVFYALSLANVRKQKIDYPKSTKLNIRMHAMENRANIAYESIKPIVELYAQKGVPSAQVFLGDMYYFGRGAEKNEKKARELFLHPAELGEVYAQVCMGRTYKKTESAIAETWYRKAADKNFAWAQRELGDIYFEHQNYETALELYRRAAGQNDSNAQIMLGVAYDNALGVNEDPAQAAEWYRKAAEQGVAYAQNALGNMYRIGRGVTKDEKKSVELYTQAAEQGLADAQENLGFMYYSGQGVEQDMRKAFDWTSKSAEQGNVTSQFNLGYMYETGANGTIDLNKAREWYTKASEQGYEDAKEALKRVEARIYEQEMPPRKRELSKHEIMSIARKYGFEIVGGRTPTEDEQNWYSLKGLENYELYAKRYWSWLPPTYYVAVLSCGVRYVKTEMFKGYGGLITYDELRNNPEHTYDYLRGELSCMDEHCSEIVVMLMELKELE